MALFDGLPLHPLIVHAPVILIPLVAAGLILLLIRPSLRGVLAPIVAVLAIGAAVTSFAAVWSGDELAEALGRGDELAHHESWGRLTRTFGVLLAIGATAVAAVDRFRSHRSEIASVVGIVTTGLAVAAVLVVGITGHAGATLAWEGKVADPTVAGDSLAATVAAESRSRAVADVEDAGSPGVDVVLGEWALVPSVQEAPPGTITFRFRNLGAVPHALRIRTPGSGGDRLEWRSERVAPGESGLLVADLAPGTYEVDCPVEDGHGEHDALGMEMLFTVREGAAALKPLPAGGRTQAAELDARGEGPAASGPEADAPEARAPEAGAPAGVASATVAIQAFAFEPATLRVPVGTEVVWANHDPAPHTATGEGFDTGRLESGASGSTTFDTPGTYDYICEIHPAMQGRVTVDP